MTATITPSVKIKRNDPNVRRADYFNAFRYWLDHPDPRFGNILLMENSGADLSEFHAAARKTAKRVEIISVPPSPPPPAQAYGYSELEMMDFALGQSKLRQETTHMVKLTGRLIYPTLPRLLNKIPDWPAMVADSRKPLPFRRTETVTVTSQLFVVKHDFYDLHLRKSYLVAHKDARPFFVEHVFWLILSDPKVKDQVMFRFPINCEPEGYGGATNRNYANPQRRMVRVARAAGRVLAPGFWL